MIVDAEGHPRDIRVGRGLGFDSTRKPSKLSDNGAFSQQ